MSRDAETVALAALCQRIIDSDASWRAKHGAIFRDSLKGRVSELHPGFGEGPIWDAPLDYEEKCLGYNAELQQLAHDVSALPDARLVAFVVLEYMLGERYGHWGDPGVYAVKWSREEAEAMAEEANKRASVVWFSVLEVPLCKRGYEER